MTDMSNLTAMHSGTVDVLPELGSKISSTMHSR